MYAKHCCELNILDALARKSAVMKETTPEQVHAGVLFPCDYGVFIEPNSERINDIIATKLNLTF